MRWQGGRESKNVEDRRMITPGRVAVGGGLRRGFQTGDMSRMDTFSVPYNEL
jgi:predicted metalloprotease